LEVQGDIVLNKYKEDFSRISDDILKEKVRLERKNFEISKEINEITNKLKTEKNISVKQRAELQRYLVSLESALNDNQLAFLRAEERTQGLIFKLKKIILQKDSINLIANQKMLVAEKDKLTLEKKFRRNLIVFSVVTFILILFALVFYLIAEKFKKQKKQIQGVNRELEAVKNDLEQHVEEVDRQKEQIEEKNKQLDAFVYKASHDIKGPLKSVIGLTKVGIQTITDPESVEIFGHILKSTTKLDNLVLDLLTLSKSKQSSLVKTNINLLNMVDEVLLSFSHSEAFAKMNFEKNIAGDLTFFSDERLLYSIVQNFIENGIKYRDDSKSENFLKITMSENHNNELTMVFEDNGIGIDDIHKDKIFNMFYKVNEKSNGTGLGLHIVKMNIEKLGGAVDLESTAGKGSIFTLVFVKSN
jgi:signal transduction histidine kinase